MSALADEALLIRATAALSVIVLDERNARAIDPKALAQAESARADLLARTGDLGREAWERAGFRADPVTLQARVRFEGDGPEGSVAIVCVQDTGEFVREFVGATALRDAEEFVGTLPDAVTGRYAIDYPCQRRRPHVLRRCVRVLSHGHAEDLSFEGWAGFVIQDEDVARRIARRMLDGQVPYPLNEEDPEAFAQFEVLDAEVLRAALKNVCARCEQPITLAADGAWEDPSGACGCGEEEHEPGGPPGKFYTVEVRTEIRARDDGDALRQAERLAGLDGRVTAVFNDEWEEIG